MLLSRYENENLWIFGILLLELHQQILFFKTLKHKLGKEQRLFQSLKQKRELCKCLCAFCEGSVLL